MPEAVFVDGRWFSWRVSMPEAVFVDGRCISRFVSMSEARFVDRRCNFRRVSMSEARSVDWRWIFTYICTLNQSQTLHYEIHFPYTFDPGFGVGRAGLVGSDGRSAVDDDVFGGRGEVATQ